MAVSPLSLDAPLALDRPNIPAPVGFVRKDKTFLSATQTGLPEPVKVPAPLPTPVEKKATAPTSVVSTEEAEAWNTVTIDRRKLAIHKLEGEVDLKDIKHYLNKEKVHDRSTKTIALTSGKSLAIDFLLSCLIASLALPKQFVTAFATLMATTDALLLAKKKGETKFVPLFGTDPSAPSIFGNPRSRDWETEGEDLTLAGAFTSDTFVQCLFRVRGSYFAEYTQYSAKEDRYIARRVAHPDSDEGKKIAAYQLALKAVHDLCLKDDQKLWESPYVKLIRDSFLQKKAVTKAAPKTAAK